MPPVAEPVTHRHLRGWGMYPQAVIQELKERLSIVTMIGEIVPLKKAGRNYRGLCPFHQEKTPSFHVHEEKQIFHCFGCGEGGDLIHFFMKRDGRTFREAVEYLAQRAGVELPAVGSEAAEVLQQRRRQEKLLLRVNVVAAEYFQQALMDVERPRIYLESRGYRDAGFFTQHLLGYADDRWDSLVHFFQQRRVPMELAVHVGLIKKRPQKEGHYDFFRDRLIFPIRDSHGAIVAFGGRDLGDGEADGAKYLNTAESPIFHKGEMLYGFPMAADAMRRADRALVVEGYLDVLALHRVGLEETVAPLGTALTAGHLRQIVRYTKNIWLLFDADAAGQRAAKRVLPLFLPLELVPRMVILPASEDPDSYAAKAGLEALRQLIDGARRSGSIPQVEWGPCSCYDHSFWRCTTRFRRRDIPTAWHSGSAWNLGSFVGHWRGSVQPRQRLRHRRWWFPFLWTRAETASSGPAWNLRCRSPMASWP
ncbi:MAG: DNA primase [Deltaproteobacteria bacterium]|nr:DNA primase [Deltaproteobacteria bacterium]